MKKVYADAAEALDGLLFDGMTIAAGGFGLCGIPENLIAAIRDSGVKDLTIASNNAGVDDFGLGILLASRQVKKMISSYVGENAEFMRQYLSGELELEVNPQGTLAERMRAGGSGIPAFFPATGGGTQVAEGGIPWRYNTDGTVAQASEPKEVRVFDGVQYVLERSIVTDYALVRAAKGDRHGNLVYDFSARNFNPLCAMSGRITIAEVEELVEPGELDPVDVHTPGVFVQRVVVVGEDGKRIERRTVRSRTEES
ncbi:succinyl-CoA--3-ketoacid CoA transferase subunit A [soil metagenome]